MEIRGRINTIQTTALLKFARILRRVLVVYLIEFYGISTHIGYLMPNPVSINIYIYNL